MTLEADTRFGERRVKRSGGNGLDRRTEDQVRRVERLFQYRFGGRPLLVRSPGRINLIGEHTDYNEGFVLPGAVDRAMVLAVGPRPNRRCRLHAADFEADFEADLDHLAPAGLGWPDYLLGVAAVLERAGHRLDGFDCALGGDLPAGAGLASSAAVTAGLAFALNELFGLGLDRLSLARLAQRTEQESAGVRCGLMDPYANLFGREDTLLLLDCCALTHREIPFAFPRVEIVLCDTGVRHRLAGSEYNLRRRQGEAGVMALRAAGLAVDSLRNVTVGQLEDLRAVLDPVVWRRCRHVVTENGRVEAAVADLERGELEALGQRLAESHRSLRDDYEVSCPELDTLVDIAAAHPAVIGSRMMGGGFGGCTVSLVRSAGEKDFRTLIRREYLRRTGRETVVHRCRLGAGTRLVLPETS